MENVEVPPSRRSDKVGRDVSRTPMQWDDSPNAGFSSPGAEPWLPVAADYAQRNMAVESADPDSVLSLYRRMLAFRRGSDALRRGSFVRVPVHGNALAYLREASGDRAFAAVNFGAERIEVAVPAGTVAVATSRWREGDRVDGSCTLEGNEALVVSLD